MSGSIALLHANTQNAIKDDADVLQYLATFEGDLVETLAVETESGPEMVYRIKEVRGNIQLYKYAIGPLEIVITYDSVTLGIVLEAFIKLPFLPKISVGKVSGSLKEGIHLKLGYKSILSGELNAILKDGHGYLQYKFTVLGKSYKGEVIIF